MAVTAVYTSFDKAVSTFIGNLSMSAPILYYIILYYIILYKIILHKI